MWGDQIPSDQKPFCDQKPWDLITPKRQLLFKTFGANNIFHDIYSYKNEAVVLSTNLARLLKGRLPAMYYITIVFLTSGLYYRRAGVTERQKTKQPERMDLMDLSFSFSANTQTTTFLVSPRSHHQSTLTTPRPSTGCLSDPEKQ